MNKLKTRDSFIVLKFFAILISIDISIEAFEMVTRYALKNAIYFQWKS